MILFIIIELYLLVCGFFLSKHDAESYLLKDKTNTTSNTLKIINRWHLDGVILAILINIPLLHDFYNWWWQLIIINILLRLSEFDLVFNIYAHLSIYFLGSTATMDKIFSKIFGKNGALNKSLTSFGLLIIFNILKIIFHF